MAAHKSPLHSRQSDRRSLLDRRWIKGRYLGKERRSGKDRRIEIQPPHPDQELSLSKTRDSRDIESLKKLLLSNTIQLEALIRVLLAKGIVAEDELLDMMQTLQSEYQRNSKS
jgi:hypothetical protein